MLNTCPIILQCSMQDHLSNSVSASPMCIPPFWPWTSIIVCSGSNDTNEWNGKVACVMLESVLDHYQYGQPLWYLRQPQYVYPNLQQVPPNQKDPWRWPDAHIGNPVANFRILTNNPKAFLLAVDIGNREQVKTILGGSCCAPVWYQCQREKSHCQGPISARGSKSGHIIK